MPFPLTGQFAIMLASQPCHFPKISAGGGRKSAGTVRSRRMKFCEKGFGGCATNKQKLRFPATPATTVLSICIYKCPACKVVYLRKTSYRHIFFSGRPQYSRKNFAAIWTGLIAGIIWSATVRFQRAVKPIFLCAGQGQPRHCPPSCSAFPANRSVAASAI